MIRLFVRHSVEDYSAWKKVYDSVDEERRSMGVTDDAVFQSAEGYCVARFRRLGHGAGIYKIRNDAQRDGRGRRGWRADDLVYDPCLIPGDGYLGPPSRHGTDQIYVKGTLLRTETAESWPDRRGTATPHLDLPTTGLRVIPDL